MFSIKFVHFKCISCVKLNKYFSLSLTQNDTQGRRKKLKSNKSNRSKSLHVVENLSTTRPNQNSDSPLSSPSHRRHKKNLVNFDRHDKKRREKEPGKYDQKTINNDDLVVEGEAIKRFDFC